MDRVMNESMLINCFFGYGALNLCLYIADTCAPFFKTFHKIASAVDNLLFIALLSYGLFTANKFLVLIVPCILLIVYPIAYGINTELSEDEKMHLVTFKTFIPLPCKIRKRLALAFLNIATFPFFYLIKSWKKK